MKMRTTRRSFLLFSAGLTAHQAWGQVMSSRDVKPQAAPPPSGRPFGARFTDIAEMAGLRSAVVYGGVATKKYILETDGCGCAFIDYDNDGWMDIFLLSGTRLEGNPPEATNRLYKNNRDGTFTDVTDKAGLRATGWANAVCVADYNNDGFDDIFCTYFGQNRLYRNNGNGTFTDVTRQAGLWVDSADRWGAGCAFLDYDRDGNLDLFVSNYIRFSFERTPAIGVSPSCNWKGVPVNCGPRGLPLGRHSLYHNNGDGTFTEVTRKAGISESTDGYGMTVVAADFDEDGWPDIFVACDSMPSLLFMNNRDGTFREEGVMRGVALSEDGLEQAGMGVGIGDYNLDGHLDLFKTHFIGDTCGVYRNDGKGAFEDVTTLTKVGVETRYTSWGTGFADFDNDGYPDLLVVTGSVYPEVERTLPQYPYKTPRIVFRNLGNETFEEMRTDLGNGIAATHSSRGCAFGDFDNDGDVDVLIVNLNEPPSLLRNDVDPKQRWLKVKLDGVKSNRSAIGARVIVHYGGKKQAQAVLSQSSYYSCSDPRLHFGLGNAKVVDIEIFLPSGLHEMRKNIDTNQLVTLREGVGRLPNKGWHKSG